MHRHRSIAAAFALAALALAACPAALSATPVEIAVNPAVSDVSVQFCIQGSCDTDVSPATGFVDLRLDSVADPAALTLVDFSLDLTQTIDLFISFGIVGNITATGQNVGLDFADPGIPLDAVPVDANGDFFYAAVPAASSGMVNYSATGLVCSLIQGAGLPCVDTINLAEQGLQAGDFAGHVEVLPGRVVSVILSPFVSGPVNPDNPALGTLTISGTIAGQAAVPLPGDANLDGTVDGRDVPAFVAVMLDPDAFAWQPRYATDMNDDDAFDAADAAAFADCLVNGNCPQ